MNPETLQMWTVYDNPRDFPGLFVVRRFEVCRGEVRACEERTASTLDAARALIPDGLACLERDPSDEPQIVETWV